MSAQPNSRSGIVLQSSNGRRLIGWKAIGQFLGCTERTARRWEAERALPVQRIPGGSRRSVWAHPDELSAWLEALPSQLPAPALPSDEPAPAAAGTPAETPAPPVASPAGPATAAPPAERRWPLWRVSAVVLGLSLVGAGILDFVLGHRTYTAPAVTTAYDDNLEARATYMTARYELSTRSVNGLSSAERDFRQLVERYPERAAGWSGLAETYLLLREFGSMPDQVAYPQAARAARTAITLDPRAATAWLDQAFISWWWQGDGSKAFREFSRALQLDPTSARAHHWFATALAARGNFPQALEEIARARALNPDNRAIVADEAYIRYSAGNRPDDAVATLVRLTQLDPSFESPHFYLSRIYLLSGRDQDFLHEALTAAQLRGQEDVRAQLQLAAQQLQNGGRQAMLDQLSLNEAARWQAGRGSAVYVAEYRALAHDRTGMLRWLAVAADAHDHNLPSLSGYPEFSSYLRDPDLLALVSGAGRTGSAALGPAAQARSGDHFFGM
jgi:tetratricopeptide (TPR) repeat protein